MSVPWLVHAGFYAILLPLLAGWWARDRLDPARGRVLIWCVVVFCSGLSMRVAAFVAGSNLQLSYVLVPTEGAVLLWALVRWQTTPLLRLIIKAAIPASLAAYAALVLILENIATFSTGSAPMFALLGFAATLATLISRASDETEPLTRQDWFWVMSGLAIYFGTTVAVAPLANILLARREFELVNEAYKVRGAFRVLAFALVAAGMLCPPRLPEAMPQPEAAGARAGA